MTPSSRACTCVSARSALVWPAFSTLPPKYVMPHTGLFCSPSRNASSACKTSPVPLSCSGVTMKSCAAFSSTVIPSTIKRATSRLPYLRGARLAHPASDVEHAAAAASAPHAVRNRRREGSMVSSGKYGPYSVTCSIPSERIDVT